MHLKKDFIRGRAVLRMMGSTLEKNRRKTNRVGEKGTKE